MKDMSVSAFKIASHLTSIVRLDHVWLASSAIELSPVPGWAGFNQLVTDSQDTPFFDVSDVVTLPFINLNPSDLSTIYTAIKFAQKEATLYNRDYCLITFDQPLFVKAVDIVSASDDLAGSVIIRLGGLHMTFSFMGSDGYIMSDSGMEQLWGTTYASGSIAQMLTGQAYSRALRANILTAQAIVSCVLSLSADVFADVDKLTLQRTWDDLLHEAISLQEALDSKEFTKLAHTVSICLSDAKQLGRTAMLWITKLERVMTLLRFIRAERTGDWALHIETVREMLPTFHAAGHTAYAKSAQLYLQQMERLESVLPPTDFEKYTNNGYFTVRRTNRFWAGIWTDMTIAQVVMKNLKGRHGVTRGRGITDSTLAYFTSALPACVPIMEAIEELSGVRTESSEQHAQHRDHRDLRPARQKRDADDRMAFVHWLTTHNPFAAQFNKDNRVCSVFSGVSADETINCERAHAIGSFLQEKMVGHNFADITMQRSGKVQPLAALTSSVTMKGEPVVIDQQQMLIRCLSIMQSGADLEDFVTYEFVNYAPSLFDNFSMRKTVKSALIQSLGIESHGNENNRSYNMVVDGGHLMMLLHGKFLPHIALYWTAKSTTSGGTTHRIQPSYSMDTIRRPPSRALSRSGEQRQPNHRQTLKWC